MKIAAASMTTTNGPVSAQSFSNVNQFMLQNLQTLISSNPEFLTGGIPTQLLSQLMNAAEQTPAVPAIKMQPPKMAQNNYQNLYNQQFQQQQEEEEHDDEEMGVAETYADYWPAKRKRHLKIVCILFFYCSYF